MLPEILEKKAPRYGVVVFLQKQHFLRGAEAEQMQQRLRELEDEVYQITSYGLHSHGLCSYGVYSYGLHSCGLCSCGRYSDIRGSASSMARFLE